MLNTFQVKNKHTRQKPFHSPINLILRRLTKKVEILDICNSNQHISMDVPTNILNEIANNLEAGEKCFIHKQTLEIVTYPDDTQFSDDEMFIEAFGKDVEKVEG